jgi:hypothetical protein
MLLGNAWPGRGAIVSVYVAVWPALTVCEPVVSPTVNAKGEIVRVSGCDFTAGVPEVLARMLMLLVPVEVVEEALIVKVTATGAPATGCALVGAKMQVTPAGNPPHARFTVPLNDPEALTLKVTEAEFPCATEMLFGEGAPIAKSTTWSTTVASCAMWNESPPTPCTLNE